MKFGAGYLYKLLSNKTESRESRHSDRHTTLNGINDILSYFEHFYPTGKNSALEIFTKMY
jgi:hypothetical protein